MSQSKVQPFFCCTSNKAQRQSCVGQLQLAKRVGSNVQFLNADPEMALRIVGTRNSTVEPTLREVECPARALPETGCAECRLFLPSPAIFLGDCAMDRVFDGHGTSWSKGSLVGFAAVWKLLSAARGNPGRQPTDLSGQPTAPVPTSPSIRVAELRPPTHRLAPAAVTSVAACDPRGPSHHPDGSATPSARISLEEVEAGSVIHRLRGADPAGRRATTGHQERRSCPAARRQSVIHCITRDDPFMARLETIRSFS